MSHLRVYADNDPKVCNEYHDFDDIAAQLSAANIQFERWEARQSLSDDCTQEDVLAAYQGDVDRLMQAHGFQTADVVSLTPDHPDKAAFRAKFLDEHTHSEDEVRFFVDGSGTFYIHADGKVFRMLCEKGDLLSVPAGTKHWFDMSEQPFFKCIRLFTSTDGWVANWTGDDIAKQFPKMGED